MIPHLLRNLTVLVLATCCARGAIEEKSMDAIHSGVAWYDDHGNMVSAHGAGIIKEGDRYYLFGEFKRDHSNEFNGFSCYSSTDLMNWKFENIALPVQKDGRLGPNRVGERPKVMKCPKTGEFVMFMHTDDISAATYVWQPLQFDAAGKISLPEFRQSWKVDTKTGRWSQAALEGKIIDSKDHDRVRYSEGWAPHIDAAGLSDMRSNVKGSAFTFAFTGSQIGLYGVARSDGGFGQVQIKDAKGDVVLTTVVETYCLYGEASLKFLSPKLKRGDYTLTATVLGERFHWQAKSATYGSTDDYVSVQKLLVIE